MSATGTVVARRPLARLRRRARPAREFDRPRFLVVITLLFIDWMLDPAHAAKNIN